jgi:ligand-binding SRPBCC domain-containing protein
MRGASQLKRLVLSCSNHPLIIAGSYSFNKVTMRHTFQATQWVPYSTDRVFAFFANPHNLHRLMPAWQKARIESSTIVAPLKPGESEDLSSFAGKGSVMTITFLPFPLSPFRLHWVALIVEFEWNSYFCDEQPKGPFAYWRHCHRVNEERRNGVNGTRVMDDLIYELPLGILAEPAHFLVVRGQVEEIFAYRQRRLVELLGASKKEFSGARGNLL